MTCYFKQFLSELLGKEKKFFDKHIIAFLLIDFTGQVGGMHFSGEVFGLCSVMTSEMAGVSSARSVTCGSGPEWMLPEGQAGAL